MSKLIKEMAQKVAEKAKEAKMPETKAPKEPVVNKKDFNPKFASKEEREVLGLVGMMKQLRAAKGHELTGADRDAIDAKIKGMKAVSLTTDAALDDTFATGPTSGMVERDIWEETNVSRLINYKEVQEGGVHDILENDKLKVYRVAEGDTGTQSNSSYTLMRYELDKIFGTTGASYETLADSLIDVAAEKMADLRRGMAVGTELAIISGDNTATHMDDVDYYGDAFSGTTSTQKSWKGLRRIALSKDTVDFGGAALTDAALFTYILAMQEAGGKYLDANQVAQGNVVLMVTQNLYNRLRLMADYTDASKSGMPSTLAGMGAVNTIGGIPVVISSYMPSLVQADGTVGDGTSGSANTLGSMIMFNKSMFISYAKSGSIITEMKREPSNQTIEWYTSARFGFNGKYDRPDSAGTVDTSHKYAIAGININLTRTV